MNRGIEDLCASMAASSEAESLAAQDVRRGALRVGERRTYRVEEWDVPVWVLRLSAQRVPCPHCGEWDSGLRVGEPALAPEASRARAASLRRDTLRGWAMFAALVALLVVLRATGHLNVETWGCPGRYDCPRTAR